MYGGVAQTYCLWKMDGEPFKENNTYYVYMLHPITKARKRVRFYTDKKHADLMPKTKANDFGSFYKVFGFESDFGHILCIKKKDITEAEEEQYFGTRNGWRFGTFYGGVWYAPEETDVPPIKNAAHAFYPDWLEFRVAGQEHSRKLGMVSEAESPWFKED